MPTYKLSINLLFYSLLFYLSLFSSSSIFLLSFPIIFILYFGSIEKLTISLSLIVLAIFSIYNGVSTVLPLSIFIIYFYIVRQYYIENESSLFLLGNIGIIFTNVLYILMYSIDILTLNFLLIIGCSIFYFLLLIKTLEIHKSKYYFKAINVNRSLASSLIVTSLLYITYNLNLDFLDLSLIITIYFILLYNYLGKKDLSLVLSCAFFILEMYYNSSNFGIYMIILNIMYYKYRTSTSFSIIFILATDLIFIHTIDETRNISMIIGILIFELYKFNYKKPLDKVENNNESVNNYISNLSNEILQFASFLESFSKNHLVSNKYITSLDESFKEIKFKLCSRCRKNSYCYNHKTKTYELIKLSLTNGSDIYHTLPRGQIEEYKRHCIKYENLVLESNLLKNKYKLNNKTYRLENTLKQQIEGISISLRQFCVNTSTLDDDLRSSYISLKSELESRLFKVIEFNPRNLSANNFLFEIGIFGVTTIEVNTIVKRICENVLKTEVKLETTKLTDYSIYFTVTKQNKFIINHGASLLSNETQDISGDNYIVKSMNNNKFIAAISDGMGSGYKAYNESKSTIKIIDKITDLQFETGSSLNLLNTFYSLKDAIEQYATLDLIDIDTVTGKSTLFKMGGTNTYIIRDNKIRVIKNENLPFGMNELIATEDFNIMKNDTIILASDGITDALPENKLIKCMLDANNLQAEIIASKIVSTVRKESILEINDDMSVVVLKVST